MIHNDMIKYVFENSQVPIQIKGHIRDNVKYIAKNVYKWPKLDDEGFPNLSQEKKVEIIDSLIEDLFIHIYGVDDYTKCVDIFESFVFFMEKYLYINYFYELIIDYLS